MNHESYLLSLKPEERAYYDELRGQPIELIEQRLATLRAIRTRFVGTCHLYTFMFVSSCYEICQHLIVEHAARTGLCLTREEVEAVNSNAGNDASAIRETAVQIGLFTEPDAKLLASIDQYFDTSPIETAHH